MEITVSLEASPVEGKVILELGPPRDKGLFPLTSKLIISKLNKETVRQSINVYVLSLLSKC